MQKHFVHDLVTCGIKGLSTRQLKKKDTNAEVYITIFSYVMNLLCSETNPTEKERTYL